MSGSRKTTNALLTAAQTFAAAAEMPKERPFQTPLG
jgi:hypothetical protein